MTQDSHRISPRVNVIGLGMGIGDLTENHLKMIRNAELLVGGARHLDYFKDLPVEKRRIDKGLKALVEDIAEKMQYSRVVVLASGDPLYYGIGSYLVNHLGAENIVFHPNISTVAAAFARIGTPWQGVPVVSLHGRQDQTQIDHALENSSTVAVYTDTRNHPAELAGYLLDRGYKGLRLCVLEQLGNSDEKIRWFTPESAAGCDFKEPNFVVIQKDNALAAPVRKPFIGMPDHWFNHEKGLITKPEIRAVSLSRLRLEPHHRLWDLGAGSGAVSIEASSIITRGEIVAVEQKKERVTQIRENRSRFQVHRMDIVHGDILETMDSLADPDRVFIGGGGKNLGRIIRKCVQRIPDGGIIVTNTVLLDSFHDAVSAMDELDLDTDVAQIQVSLGRPMPWSRRMEARTPVWIVTGIKTDRK